MIYLILAIFCSSCITLVLKIGSKYTENRYAVLTCNYITCVIMVIIFMPKNTAIFSDASGRTAMALGLVNGILYLVCMSYNQINVVKNGAILTATFVRLGVVVPTLLSILFYKEIPSVVQVIGIFLVLIAFVVMGMSGKGNQEVEVKIVLRDLILLMILGGVTDSMSKVFEQTCSMELADWFLLITFFVALVICILVTIYSKQHIGKKECLVGIAIGIPNYLSTLFLLQSLGKIPAFLAYPTYSVGSILVVITVSYILLREKLDKMQKVSIGFIMLALLFLNM